MIKKPFPIRFVLLFLSVISLTACTTIDKLSKDAASVDDDINASGVKIQHNMDHYQG